MRHRQHHSSLRAALVLAAALAPLGCQSPGPAAQPTPGDRERVLNLDSFDVAWQTVRDRHWDPALCGVDWNAIRDEYRPRVARAATREDARRLLDEALLRLRQSHCQVIAADVIEDMAHGSGGSHGDVGFRVRVVNRRALVVSLRSGTPAAARGVRPGWELHAVDGTPVATRLARVDAEYADSTLNQLMLVGAINTLLTGPIGESVSLEFIDEYDQPRTIEVARVAPRGEPAGFGEMPATHVWFESRRLDDQVGYIAFNAFLDPDRLMSDFEHAIRELGDARGLILDLRGNVGGIGGMAMGIAGWFVSNADHPLGTMRLRETTLRFAVFPRPNTYHGPLAILVDGCTASTAEILAGGLQDLGRARIFGERTAGAALPSLFVRLPNGDGLQYPYADYVSASGVRLEGVGVRPDIEIGLSRGALLAGHDPVLEAAAEWIRSDVASTTTEEPSAAAGARRVMQTLETGQ